MGQAGASSSSSSQTIQTSILADKVLQTDRPTPGEKKTKKPFETHIRPFLPR